MNTYYLGQIKVNNEVISVFVKREDEDSIGFYDSYGNLLAAKEPNYQLLPSERYRDMPPEFLSQIDSLWTDLLHSRISIEKRNRELEDLADMLGIRKEKIISCSSIELSQTVECTSEKKDKTQSNDTDKIVSNLFHAKQEIALDKLVDDRYTLGEILGVNDSNATLVCVHSSDIKTSNRSNSEFSFLIKYPDGRLEEASMLSQEDGIHSVRDVYASNRDGSSVNKVNMRSMYRLTSPLGKESMISVSYGSTGTLEFQYGKRDVTEQDFIAVPLSTTDGSTRYVTKEVQEYIESDNGIYHTHAATAEASKHFEHGCNDLSLEEADGDENTGHQHLEKELDEDYYLTIAANILKDKPQLEEQYSVKGLADDLRKYLANHPEKTIDDFAEDRAADCDHYPSIQK